MTRIEQIANFIKVREGLYSNDPDDHGGETRRGITFETYKHYCAIVGAPVMRDQFMAMSDGLWLEIFNAVFYSRCGADRVTDGKFALALTDFAWHSGARQSVLELQTTINYFDAASMPLAQDGIIGVNTLSAVNTIEPCDLYELLFCYCTRRGNYLDHLADASGQSKWRGGWLSRVFKLMDYAYTTRWDQA